MAADACHFLGVNWLARKLARRKVLVLCYHGVVAAPQKDRFRYATTVGAAEFEEHMDALRQFFHPISLSDLLHWYEGSQALPDNPVLVTFDDGYRNNLSLAASVLRRRQIPCVFHVTAAYIGTRRVLWPDEVITRVMDWPHATIPTPDDAAAPLPLDKTARRGLAQRWKEQCKHIRWEKLEAYLERLRQVPADLEEDEERYGFLGWDEVRDLQRQGFEIGSHTMEHPILTQTSPDRLAWELKESKRRIEAETGAPCLAIAYPNGGAEDFSEAVVAAAQKAGYRLGFTIVEEFNRAPVNALAVNRLCVMGHLPASEFHLRVSGAAGLLPRA
jgi:peptidoglycan/xylan/chitin deacetylase (PgdA/CDA1 family)